MLSRVLSGADSDFTPLFAAAALQAVNRPQASRPPVEPDPAAARDEQEAGEAARRRLREAYESGFCEGKTAAVRKTESQVRDVVEKFCAAVTEVAGTRSEVMRRAEADIVRLSMEIARRILHREISVDPGSLQALVRAALEKLQAQDLYKVRVHPEHEQTVRTCLREAGRDPAVEVVADHSQPRGGAVFETSRGSLDASIETQLLEIERGLADELGERS